MKPPADNFDFSLLLFGLALLFAGCSNAPPVGYSNMGKPGMVGATLSIKPNFLQYHNRFQDTLEYERPGDGTMTKPLWMSNDYFYTGFRFTPYILDFGAYLTNFYPGAYFGVKHKFVSANYFVTTSLISNKVLPGWQVSVNLKNVLLNYSSYKENVGSYMTNPAMGESGPSMVGQSQRYFLGYEMKQGGEAIAVGVYFNQTFFKEVSTFGIEGSTDL